jgi:uncharacterized protein YjbI with pentapeptide repeats
LRSYTIRSAYLDAELREIMKLYSLKGEYLCDLQELLGDEQREQLVIENADLKGKNLVGIVLRNLLFSGGDLEGADLSGAKIENTVFEGTWMPDALLKNAKLSNVEFYDVEGYGANFSDATLSKVRFMGSNLSQTDFSRARLTDVNFEKDNITHATSLFGANFSAVVIFGTRMVGALYDAHTLFPPEFDPGEHIGLMLE